MYRKNLAALVAESVRPLSLSRRAVSIFVCDTSTDSPLPCRTSPRRTSPSSPRTSPPPPLLPPAPRSACAPSAGTSRATRACGAACRTATSGAARRTTRAGARGAEGRERARSAHQGGGCGAGERGRRGRRVVAILAVLSCSAMLSENRFRAPYKLARLLDLALSSLFFSNSTATQALHPVQRSALLDKVRIVDDCARRCENVSLCAEGEKRRRAKVARTHLVARS